MTPQVSNLIDAIIEAPIVTSFTRIGFDVRSRLDHWTDTSSTDLSGRVMLVTGATSGLGRSASEALARAGAIVVLLGRDPAKTARVCAELIEATGNDQLHSVVADMGDLDAVRTAATEVREQFDHVEVLVHNAGTLSATRHVASCGVESTVASQVLGPFLLTGLLLPLLQASPSERPARVLTMSSGGMYAAALTVDRLEMGLVPGDDYRGVEQYARAKRAQVTINEMWATRFPDRRVVFHAVHPGWADTPGVEASLPTFRKIVGPLLRTPQQGADTLVWLAADDGAPIKTSGQFWLDRRPRAIHKLSSTRRSDTLERRRQLWQWCVDRTGVDAGDIDVRASEV